MSDSLLVREPEITDALVAAHGLKPDEYRRILDLIGRTPTLTELGIFSAMWNEHCSYKSSKKWLRTLPTTGPQVICGPGENAGVVDIGDGTGAGLQDGEPQPPLLYRALPGGGDRGRRHPARRLHHGRAADRGDERAVLRRAGASEDPGAGARAWSRGSAATAMPSGCRRSAASCGFTPPMTATAWSTPLPPGWRRPTRIFYSAASGVGMPVVYLGAKTGRDGVGGATMASAEFDDTHRGEAADGAGRRPLHREAADGGLPRADGDRGGDLDPGHGRGRADLLGGGDGRQGRSRDPARPRPGAGARARDDRLRDDAVARARSGC